MADYQNHGGRLIADVTTPRVTHIIIDREDLEDPIDISEYQALNRKSYQELASTFRWKSEDLINPFARRQGEDEGPRPGKVVVRSEWVYACVKEGRQLRREAYGGYEVM